jgi:hypothetical protein
MPCGQTADTVLAHGLSGCDLTASILAFFARGAFLAPSCRKDLMVRACVWPAAAAASQGWFACCGVLLGGVW